MSRRKPELQALDVTTWPTVAWTELDAAARKHFRARMQAIERYARGEPVKDIEEATGVNRRQLYRLLERALEPHRDGRIFEFRALIAHLRVSVIEAPFRCLSCRSHFGYGRLSLLSTIPAMRRQDCIAIRCRLQQRFRKYRRRRSL
jgi:transposase-like protein